MHLRIFLGYLYAQAFHRRSAALVTRPPRPRLTLPQETCRRNRRGPAATFARGWARNLLAGPGWACRPPL